MTFRNLFKLESHFKFLKGKAWDLKVESLPPTDFLLQQEVLIFSTVNGTTPRSSAEKQRAQGLLWAIGDPFVFYLKYESSKSSIDNRRLQGLQEQTSTSSKKNSQRQCLLEKIENFTRK